MQVLYCICAKLLMKLLHNWSDYLMFYLLYLKHYLQTNALNEPLLIQKFDTCNIVKHCYQCLVLVNHLSESLISSYLCLTTQHNILLIKSIKVLMSDRLIND